jgi:signal transduction histidine kinase
MFYPPEEIAAGNPASELAEAAATGRAEREGWRARKGGERFWANEIMTAIYDAGGQHVGYTKIARDLTEQLLTEEAAERARLETAREELRRSLATAEEAERRRLARELHDQLGQHLTGFALGLAEVRRRVAAGESAEARLDQLEELARLMTRDARSLALELRPLELDDVGLAHALSTYVDEWAARFGVAAEVVVTAADRAARDALPADVGSALYRITQEALTNVAKHAGATHVSVVLEHADREVRLVIEDDGRGFDVATERARARRDRRLGLAGIEERATLVGGTVMVESTPGAGTALFVRLPAR